MTVQRFDVVPLKATRTPEGFIAGSAVVSRVGVFPYRDDSYPGGWRREFRPPEEVFSQAHLDSIKGKPITEGHPTELIVSRGDGRTVTGFDGKPWKSIGAAVSSGRKDTDDENDLVSDLVIHHTDAIDAGQKQISLGYMVEIDKTPGEWKGERYDVVQRNPRVNHIAIVASGRAGNARLNLDAADVDFTGVSQMVKVRLDSGVEFDAAPEVAHEIATVKARETAATKRADTAEAARDSAVLARDAAIADAAKARSDAMDAARARVALEAAGEAHGLARADIAPMTDLAIRKAVIAKLRGDSLKLDGKSDAYIDAAFDLAISDASSRKDNAASQAGQMTGRQEQSQDRNDGFHMTANPAAVSTAHAEMVARLTSAYKGSK